VSGQKNMRVWVCVDVFVCCVRVSWVAARRPVIAFWCGSMFRALPPVTHNVTLRPCAPSGCPCLSPSKQQLCSGGWQAGRSRQGRCSRGV
jgi:hypothetical protein